MPLFIVTDAGLPEPGAEAMAKLYAVVADNADDAASQIAGKFDAPQLALFMIDASSITGVLISKEVSLTLTPIEIPPTEGPLE